jgi:hypothetical protein
VPQHDAAALSGPGADFRADGDHRLDAIPLRHLTAEAPEERLDLLKREVKGVQTKAADVADPQVASQVLSEIRPDILILNAGARPANVPSMYAASGTRAMAMT